MAAQRGTDRHAVASELIRLKIKLPETKQTLNMYVNDAIGFRMKTEQNLFFSKNCFGTADAIQFRDDFLRIHDFKDGLIEASMDQLKVYMALFCHEYEFNPFKIGAELRIYQNDEIRFLANDKNRFIEKENLLDPDEIMHIMDKIVTFDRIIEKLRMEAS